EDLFFLFFFSSRRRHTRSKRDWSSDVCSSDLSWPKTFPLEGASCTVYALDPSDRPRQLVFYHPGRKLGGSLSVRGDEKEPPAVQIGRASCRERGESAVGAGAVKKKERRRQ